jgi:phage shock protein PspC (stress-responsive transcriptional regulator)
MSMSDELERLRVLHERGALSDAEYSAAKAQALAGAPMAPSVEPTFHTINGLRRSRGDRMVGGVCGGIAQATGMASWIVRLLFALLVLFAGTGLLIYILLWILVPEDTVYAIDSNARTPNY